MFRKLPTVSPEHIHALFFQGWSIDREVIDREGGGEKRKLSIHAKVCLMIVGLNHSDCTYPRGGPGQRERIGNGRGGTDFEWPRQRAPPVDYIQVWRIFPRGVVLMRMVEMGPCALVATQRALNLRTCVRGWAHLGVSVPGRCKDEQVIGNNDY